MSGVILMLTSMRGAFLFVLFAVPPSVIAACSSIVPTGKSCTLLGCDDGVRIHAVVAAPPSELVDGIVLVCRNEHCGRSVLTTIGADAGAPARPPDVRFADGALTFEGTVTGSVTTTFSLQVDIQGTGATPAADGDVYRLQILEAAGNVVFDQSQSVTYQTAEANGPGCGPTCHNAQIDFSPGI